jgi:eukaryotic-like serine/threonine-protein kinase
MASRPYECDRDRLRLSLEDRLSEARHTELANHLEECPDCRQELEQLAAASKFWCDAALLRGERAPGAAPTVGLAGDGVPELESEEEVGDADAGWREFLDPPNPTRPGTFGRLGPYEILEVLGRGGMGVVLKARDPALDRTVAIKLLTPALCHGATARRRFAREARAVAAVGHEHIVAIHAVDEFRGLPYLVMQYVPGRSLQERLDATGPLEVREILRIGTQAARALAAAHAQGVVHRDIKPANILLENCIERVKLTDFGLARAIDDASLTQSGLIAGTPQYMAPEQARGEPVDARADLFALGGALYAMAAGRSPFRADSTMAVLKRVCEARHRPIRELNPDVPDWLEAMIDRLLAKEPADRFQTASEVADLLEKGLAHLQQPSILPPPVVFGIAAKAGSGRELDLDPDLDPRATMPLHRARRRLPLVAALFLLSIAGLGASEAAGLTQVADFVATILRIKTPDGTMVIKVDDPNVKVQIDGDTVVIGGAGPQEIRLPVGRHRVQAIKDGKAVRDQLVTIARGGKEIVNVDFVPTETAMVAETKNPHDMSAPRSHVNQCMACHSNVRAMKLDEPLPTNHPALDARPASANTRKDSALALGPKEVRARAIVWSLAFSPDGRNLAIGQQGIDRPPSILQIWSVPRRQFTYKCQQPAGYRSIAFSSDGRNLAAGNFDGTLSTFVLADVWEFQHSENPGSPINSLAFIPNTTIIATGDWDGWVRFHGPDTVANSRPLKYPGKIWALAVSPDGSTLAVGGEANTIQVYDLATRQRKVTLEGHTHAVRSLDFSPDGKLLASAGGYTTRLWDTANWAVDRGHFYHNPEVLCVRFSPDGKLLAISDGESDLPHYKLLPTAIILWDVATRKEVRWLRGHTNSIWALAFSPDGKSLASGSADQTVKFWDTASGKLRETIVPGELGPSAFRGVLEGFIVTP